MHSFLIKYRVGSKTTEETILASNEEEARSMMENHLAWNNPKKGIKIISVKSLDPMKKRLRSKKNKSQDPFEY